MVKIPLDCGSVIVWMKTSEAYHFIYEGRKLGTLTLRDVMHSPTGMTPTEVILKWIAKCKDRAGAMGGPGVKRTKKPIEIPKQVQQSQSG